MDLDWLALQPAEEVDKGPAAAAGTTPSSDAPQTPLAQHEGRRRLQGGALSEIEPASPREAAAAGGPTFPAAAGSSRAAAGHPDGGGTSGAAAEEDWGDEELEQLVIQKHLAFSSPQARGEAGW